uniref:Uncharacterized protein n=1 Tax=Romanomermis culicivorax TaxID=13658 RepID=A0A915KM11_ROMCU
MEIVIFLQPKKKSIVSINGRRVEAVVNGEFLLKLGAIDKHEIAMNYTSVVQILTGDDDLLHKISRFGFSYGATTLSLKKSVTDKRTTENTIKYYEMGAANSSLMLQDEEIEEIQKETGCKTAFLLIYHTHNPPSVFFLQDFSEIFLVFKNVDIVVTYALFMHFMCLRKHSDRRVEICCLRSRKNSFENCCFRRKSVFGAKRN